MVFFGEKINTMGSVSQFMGASVVILVSIFIYILANGLVSGFVPETCGFFDFFEEGCTPKILPVILVIMAIVSGFMIIQGREQSRDYPRERM
jgi:hypothetical protein